MGFHDFDAGAVGVPEVELSFAVDAGGDLDGARIIDGGGAGIEDGFGFVDIGDLEAEVVLFAAVGGRGKFGVEHELDVVVGVGELDIDPAEEVGFAAAAPGFRAAEDAAIEVEGGLELADENTDVREASGDAGIGEELAFFAEGPAAGSVLGDFDGVVVRVEDIEVEVADAALVDFGGDLDAAGFEVSAHGLGVVGFEGDMVKAVGPGFSFGEEFDGLAIVDFDPGDVNRAVFVGQKEGFVEAEEILIESAGFLEVMDIKGDVGDAEEMRALGLG